MLLVPDRVLHGTDANSYGISKYKAVCMMSGHLSIVLPQCENVMIQKTNRRIRHSLPDSGDQHICSICELSSPPRYTRHKYWTSTPVCGRSTTHMKELRAAAHLTQRSTSWTFACEVSGGRARLFMCCAQSIDQAYYSRRGEMR